MVLAHDAAADNNNVLTQLDVGAVDGVNDASQRLGQAGFFVGQGVGNLEQGSSIDDDIVSQAAAGSGQQVLTDGSALALLAHVGVAGTAVVALAAVEQQTDDNAVVLSPLLLVDSAAHSDDFASDFVAAGSQHGHLQSAGEQTLLHGAQSNSMNLNQNFVRTQIGSLALHQFDLLDILECNSLNLNGHL